MFYSGVVTGPDFCTNRSLGGAQTFAHDGDDATAWLRFARCTPPAARRVARQLALEMFADPHPQFNERSCGRLYCAGQRNLRC